MGQSILGKYYTGLIHTLTTWRNNTMTVMNMTIAQKIVDSRQLNPKETWKESVETHAPHLYYLSVKAYVSKFKRGEIREREEPVYVAPRELDYTIIHKAWL